MRTRCRYLVFFLLASLLSVGTVVLWRWWPRIVPLGETSELYRRYADTPGVDATFIRGFQVNDTLALDVTLLEATDSMGWETLITDFQVTREFLTGENDHIITRKAKKGHTDRQMDTVPENNDLIIIADGMQTISIFHNTDKNQTYQIIHKETIKLKKE